LASGVAWRLHFEAPTGLGLPRITWMKDRSAAARANALFDVLHGELLLSYADQSAKAWSSMRNLAMGDEMASSFAHWDFVTQVRSQTLLTYASARLVSFTEVRELDRGPGAALRLPVLGWVFDLDKDRIFSQGSCRDNVTGDGSKFFRLVALLEICDDASFAAFANLFKKHVELLEKPPAVVRDP
jgi:hypothetical protein